MSIWPRCDGDGPVAALGRRWPAALGTRYRRVVPTDPADIDALPLPEAVLFDLDGTLIDTVETRIEAWLHALEDAGLPSTHERLAPLIGVDGKRLAREIAALAGKTLDEDRAEAIDKRSGEIYEQLNHSPRPLPGVRELVDAIEARGLPWAIATSSRKAQVATSVEALGLESEPTIVDASHVEHAKPEPDLLLRAAEEVGVDADPLLVHRRFDLGHGRGRRRRDDPDRGDGRSRGRRRRAAWRRSRRGRGDPDRARPVAHATLRPWPSSSPT